MFEETFAFPQSSDDARGYTYPAVENKVTISVGCRIDMLKAFVGLYPRYS